MSEDLRDLYRALSEKVTRLSVQMEALIKFKENAIGLVWKIGLAAVGIILWQVLKSAGVQLP